MLLDTININTYLNLILIIFVGLISFIVNGIKGDIRENSVAIRDNRIYMDRKFEKIDEKLDIIIGKVNENKINIARVEERQNLLETDIKSKSKIQNKNS